MKQTNKKENKEQQPTTEEQLKFFTNLLNFVYDLKYEVDRYDKKKLSLKHLRQLIAGSVIKQRFILNSSGDEVDDVKKAVIDYMQRSARALGYSGLKDSRIGTEEFRKILADVKGAVRLDRDLVLYVKLKDDEEIKF